MPVYNKEPYIRDTIASILAQTFSSYEVVMIGGVSSDNTDVICREFVEKDPDRFRFVIQTGKGVSNARNDGILAARGKYVAFLDADDLWVPEYLEVMANLIRDFPGAIFYAGGFSRLYSDGSVIECPNHLRRGYIDYFQQALWVHTSALIAAKETIIDVGLFKTDYVLGENIDLMIRLALRGNVAYEPTILEVHPVGRPGSLCTSGAKNIFLPIPGEPELFSTERTPQIIQFHEWQILGMAMANLDRGYPKEARKQLKGVINNRKK
ncbi:MAG: glycosyltransferase family 2 protein [Methanocalculaceae archaeon]|jgi:glycosyltransferase involved in cell wall biosynthesis|nr:glycosyltransferase family 2 protein [Methanocalculaceae archaeon]